MHGCSILLSLSLFSKERMLRRRYGSNSPIKSPLLRRDRRSSQQSQEEENDLLPSSGSSQTADIFAAARDPFSQDQDAEIEDPYGFVSPDVELQQLKEAARRSKQERRLQRHSKGRPLTGMGCVDAASAAFSSEGFVGANKKKCDDLVYLVGGLSDGNKAVRSHSAEKLLLALCDPQAWFLLRSSGAMQATVQAMVQPHSNSSSSVSSGSGVAEDLFDAVSVFFFLLARGSVNAKHLDEDTIHLMFAFLSQALQSSKTISSSSSFSSSSSSGDGNRVTAIQEQPAMQQRKATGVTSVRAKPVVKSKRRRRSSSFSSSSSSSLRDSNAAPQSMASLSTTATEQDNAFSFGEPANNNNNNSNNNKNSNITKPAVVLSGSETSFDAIALISEQDRERFELEGNLHAAGLMLCAIAGCSEDRAFAQRLCRPEHVLVLVAALHHEVSVSSEQRNKMRVRWLLRAVENISGAVVNVSELLCATMPCSSSSGEMSPPEQDEKKGIWLVRDAIDAVRDNRALRMSVLRLLVNLSNLNANACEQVALADGLPTVTAVLEEAFAQRNDSDYDDGDSVFLEQLPLAVGVLINCLECAPDTRAQIHAITTRVSAAAMTATFAHVLRESGVPVEDTSLSSSSSSSSSSTDVVGSELRCAGFFACMFLHAVQASDLLSSILETKQEEEPAEEQKTAQASSSGKKRKSMKNETEEWNALCMSFRVLSAYAGLILGTLTLHGLCTREELHALLRHSESHHHRLVTTLQDFLVLQSDAGVLTSEALQSIVDIIQVLSSSSSSSSSSQ